MTTKVHLVRLVASVAQATAGCFFVTVYSRLSIFRFEYEQPDGHLIRATAFLSQWAWVGYAVPAVALLTGIWALRRSPFSPVPVEIIIAGTWCLSLVWVGHCLLMWLAQSIPIVDHV